MKKEDLIKLSFRNFKARTGRTALTIFGMGIGIGSIIFMLGLGYGLQDLLLKSITNSQSLLALDVFPDPAKGGGINVQKSEEFSQLPGVTEVVPAYDLSVQIKYKDNVSDGTAAISTQNLILLDGKKIVKGENLGEGGENGVVLSTAFSKIFQDSPEELLGQNVNLSFIVPKKESADAGLGTTEKLDIDKNFRIVGFFEGEDVMLYANSAGIENNLSGMGYTRVKLNCDSAQTLEKTKRDLTEAGFSVSSLSDTVKEVNRIFGGINVALALFGMVALFVSAIGMFNTMTVALLERTKEIGIMKAIGASEKNILLLFIMESTTMGLFGGVAGIILGVLSGALFNLLLNFVAWKMGGNSVSLFQFPFWFLAFSLGFSMLVGFLTGLIPARRASAIDPLDALQTR